MNNILRTIVASITTALCALFAACSNDPILLDTYFASSDTFAEYSDEVPIELSTFRLDSVQTSHSGIIWIGSENKKVIGDVCSTSYIKLNSPVMHVSGSKAIEWAPKEKYDSITVVMYHTGAYQGDTTKAITIDVKRLAQPIRYAENEYSFYNVRSFRDSTSIGSFRFKPCPHTHPRVRRRLDDSFGRELVKFLQNNKAYISSDDKKMVVLENNFEKFLGGIKLEYGEDTKAMLAFRADSFHISLHSHITDMVKKKIIRTLKCTDLGMQFNHVWTENEDSPYDNIGHRSEQVSEKAGGLHSVMFEGLGYYTRINFPTIREIRSRSRDSHIVRATLKMYPERNGYDKHNFPKTFNLQVVNKGNVVTSLVSDRYGRAAKAELHFNYFDNNDVYYTIDITNYLNTVMSRQQQDVDINEGLAVAWNGGMSPTNYNFMLFNGRGKRKYYSYLELYYYNYDREDK